MIGFLIKISLYVRQYLLQQPIITEPIDLSLFFKKEIFFFQNFIQVGSSE